LFLNNILNGIKGSLHLHKGHMEYEISLPNNSYKTKDTWNMRYPYQVMQNNKC